MKSKTYLKLTCLLFATALCFASSMTAKGQTCQPAPVGLVSWYAADGNALDPRSRNDGTLQNGAAFGAGKNGQAFNLDGVDDYVEIADSPSLRPAQFTLEFWVKPSVGSINHTILTKEPTELSPQIGYGLRQRSNNKFLFIVGREGFGLPLSIESTTTLTPGIWYHLAATFDGSQSKLYVNGVSEGTGSGTATIDSTFPLMVGRLNSNLDGSFQGQIDEFSFYSRALSASEIAAIYNAGSAGKCKPTATVAPMGLVGWWAGDGNPNDISGSGNNGTPQNGLAFALGRVGQSFSFDGQNDYIQIPHNASLNFSQFTLETWIKTDQPAGTFGQIWSKNATFDGNNDPFMLQIVSNGIVGGRVGKGDGATNVSVGSSVAVNDNNWHHLALICDGATLKLYRDGNLDDSKPVSFPLFNNTQNAIIGQWAASVPNPLHNYRGLIDELSLYNRALSDAEIQSIFNAGLAGKLKAAVTPIGFADSKPGILSSGFEKEYSQSAVQNPQSVNVTIGDATVTFPSVMTAGTTQSIPLNPALFPALPMATHTGLIYDISTSVSFAGNPTVCFNLPSFTSEQFSNLRILHLESDAWQNRTASENTYPNLCTAGLTSLSPFAIAALAPTAANVSVGGRVTDASGNPVVRARVVMNGAGGTARVAVTNAFGYYRFDEVTVGQTYIFSLLSKQFQFQTQVVSVADAIGNLNFTALP